MKLTHALLALTLSLAAVPALASSDLKLDDATKTRISTMLTDQGYEVRKIKIEDGRYEASALKDGKKLEILLNENLDIVGSEVDD